MLWVERIYTEKEQSIFSCYNSTYWVPPNCWKKNLQKSAHITWQPQAICMWWYTSTPCVIKPQVSTENYTNHILRVLQKLSIWRPTLLSEISLEETHWPPEKNFRIPPLVKQCWKKHPIVELHIVTWKIKRKLFFHKYRHLACTSFLVPKAIKESFTLIQKLTELLGIIPWNTPGIFFANVQLFNRL